MNDFFVRGIPIGVAKEAIDRWDTLSDNDKAKLGFERSLLDEYLANKDSAEIIQLVKE